MRKFMISLTTIATLTLAAVPLIGLTQAARADEPVTFRVGDLNLADPADAAEFESRAASAAGQFCKARARHERLGLLSHRACLIEARAEIDEKLSRGQRRALASAGRPTPVSMAVR